MWGKYVPYPDCLLEEYEKGFSQIELAKKHGVTPSAIWYHLKQQPGYVSHKAVWTDAREAQAIAVYATGASLASTAKILKCNKRKIRYVLIKHSIKIREQSEAQTGAANPSWSGGRTKVGAYWYVYAPDHPHATKQGRVAEHRLVAEAILRRLLLPTEVVHHCDGNAENNTPSNLRIFVDNAEHLSFTLFGRVPQWSEEGRERILASVRKPRGPKRTQSHPKTDAPE